MRDIVKEFTALESSTLRPIQIIDRAPLLVSFIPQSWGSTANNYGTAKLNLKGILQV